MIRQLQLCFVLLINGVIHPVLAADRNPGRFLLSPETVVRFATVREGQEILRRRDHFVRSLSRFDLESRVGELGATQEDYLRFVGEQAMPWSVEHKQKLADTLSNISTELLAFKLPLPAAIVLVHTTGKEEGGAAHCRQNAIILPRRIVQRSATALERLLVHELFHIASSHNPRWRDRLYQMIGFHPCEDVPLPASLEDRNITNPDAPMHGHYIQIESGGRAVKAVPLLFASVDRFDPDERGSFFRYLQFRLMIVDSAQGRWTPVIRDGQPVLIDPKNNSSFYRQIGRNTDYIYHPEEILADNFVHLVLETRQLENPELVERLRQRLAK